MFLSQVGVLVCALALAVPAPARHEAKAAGHPLRDARVVQIDSTVLSNPGKGDYAANMLRDDFEKCCAENGSGDWRLTCDASSRA